MPLDVCPVDELATGAALEDLAGSFLNLIDCRGGTGVDSYDTDPTTGERRVSAHGAWPDGSEVDLGLRYTAP